MKTNLIQQYNNIRDTINKNVDTIKLMLDQAKQLSVIAESLSDASCADVKKKLEEQIQGMNTSISALIDQTTELFKLYDQFAKELFS